MSEGFYIDPSGPIPEGYELASTTAAKNIVLVELEELDPDYAAETDHIDMADRIVEALLKAGVKIPDNIADPCRV
jgi:hypothetical protein